MGIGKGFVPLAMGLTVLAAGGCAATGQGEPREVVTIDAPGPLSALPPSYPVWISDAVEGEPQALLLREGDCLIGDEGLVLRYLESDGRALTLTGEDGVVRLGGTVVALSLEKERAREWIGTATDRELALVRSVVVKGELDREERAALERLAAANPALDLQVDGKKDLAPVLPLLHPRAVIAGKGGDAGGLELLAQRPGIETLLIEAEDPGSLDFLPSMTGLRTLVLFEWRPERAGPIPPGLTGLRTLTLFLCDETDLSALRDAPEGLEELSLVGWEHLADLSGIERWTGLRTLVLAGCKDLEGLPPLDALADLRRVALPPKTTQGQFEAFVAAHPGLEDLELIECEGISDLAPLRGLGGLRGLVLDGPAERLEGVVGLDSLRFLGIGEETWDDDLDVAALREALPDAVVVRVKPLCLGSGWILLLVPALALAWVRRRGAGIGA